MPPAVVALAATVATVAVKVFVTSAILAAVLTVAITVAATMLMGKRKNSNANQGQELKLKLDPTMPRQVAVGLTATGGSLVWSFTYTDNNKKPNRYLVRIIDLSDIPIDGVNDILVEGTPLSFAGDVHTGFQACTSAYRAKNGAACMWVKVHKGGPDQAADNELVAMSGGVWTNQHKGKNIAYAIVKMDYDPDAFPNGEPGLVFIVRGASCYDDRADDTMPDGSGTQRLNDPTTWKYTRNASVITAQVLRGFYSAGVLMFGAQAEARDLYAPMLQAAHNECD
ncbi:hypothetical protein, partial [Parvimonas micra]|uniref:hypothetical protein n=2 Tax=Parvimonas micra TaxID=33033 RepID=UPI002B491E10